MFQRLTIKNFRVFRKLDVEKLGSINLFTGQNNVGKTTLLEAVFLLSSAGYPEVAINANVLRGLISGNNAHPVSVFWKELFASLDIGKIIEIAATHQPLGELRLEVESKLPPTMTSIAPGNGDDNPPNAMTNRPGERGLSFAFHQDRKQAVHGHIQIKGTGLEVSRPNADVAFPATILSSRGGSAQEDATRLGKLRREKRGDLLLDALRVVEPKLQSIEENSSSGTPMIWGDVGLPELVPLPIMGEGMTRIARIVLAISASPNGVVLVDEIENGLHHSMLKNVWQVVESAARQFGTQVFATTHSFECAEAAHQVLRNAAFRMHRLEIMADESRCVTYSDDAIAGAMAHGVDVR